MRYAELKQAYDRLVQENIFLRQELERLRTAAPGSSPLSTTDKIHLFRSLFRGREDVYAVRFSNARTGKSGYVPARLARWLGTQILTEAARHRGRPRLDSYDRFFPNQDTMPQGGLGNLIVLPLQGQAVPAGNSVFLQDDGTPHPNQWEYLRQIRRMTLTQLEERLGSEAFSEWQDLGLIDPSRYSATETCPQPAVSSVPASPPGPNSMTFVVGGRIEIPTDGLPQRVLYELVRLAAFPNPEFYRRQRLHFSTWNTPRILSMADDLGEALALPRSFLS